jgi:glycerophosphoryl diester phosphodiesterase
MRSFSKALELGATWIECDARVVENRAVIFHDRTLQRMAGVSGVIWKQRLEYVRSLPLPHNERIPLLSDVLQQLQGRCSLQIELKGASSGRVVAQELLTVLAQGWSAESLLVSSFDYEELREFRGVAPQIPIGLLVYGYPLNCIGIAQELNAHSVHLHIDSVSKERVSRLQAAGYRVFVFTANDPEDIIELVLLRVDGIFSDFPERVLQVLTGSG